MTEHRHRRGRRPRAAGAAHRAARTIRETAPPDAQLAVIAVDMGDQDGTYLLRQYLRGRIEALGVRSPRRSRLPLRPGPVVPSGARRLRGARRRHARVQAGVGREGHRRARGRPGHRLSLPRARRATTTAAAGGRGPCTSSRSRSTTSTCAASSCGASWWSGTSASSWRTSRAGAGSRRLCAPRGCRLAFLPGLVSPLCSVEMPTRVRLLGARGGTAAARGGQRCPAAPRAGLPPRRRRPAHVPLVRRHRARDHRRAHPLLRAASGGHRLLVRAALSRVRRAALQGRLPVQVPRLTSSGSDRRRNARRPRSRRAVSCRCGSEHAHRARHLHAHAPHGPPAAAGRLLAGARRGRVSAVVPPRALALDVGVLSGGGLYLPVCT